VALGIWAKTRRLIDRSNDLVRLPEADSRWTSSSYRRIYFSAGTRLTGRLLVNPGRWRLAALAEVLDRPFHDIRELAGKVGVFGERSNLGGAALGGAACVPAASNLPDERSIPQMADLRAHNFVTTKRTSLPRSSLRGCAQVIRVALANLPPVCVRHIFPSFADCNRVGSQGI
jgi:hypothetical protein